MLQKLERNRRKKKVNVNITSHKTAYGNNLEEKYISMFKGCTCIFTTDPGVAGEGSGARF
jgi:hypothetical protein